MQKNKAGLIVIAAVVALVVVVYLGFFRKSSQEHIAISEGGQTAVSPQESRTKITAQSGQLEKGDMLAFSPGQQGGATVAAPPGSWFGLELVKGFSTFVGLQPGPDGGIIIGKAQSASGSHSGIPDGKEVASVDTTWVFFGSTGMHFTTGNGIKFISSGQLDFSAWRWTWNGVPEINLGQGKTASFNWSGEYGKPFVLEYQAIVPSDVPGFGGKKYALHLEGAVKRP